VAVGCQAGVGGRGEKAGEMSGARRVGRRYVVVARRAFFVQRHRRYACEDGWRIGWYGSYVKSRTNANHHELATVDVLNQFAQVSV